MKTPANNPLINTLISCILLTAGFIVSSCGENKREIGNTDWKAILDNITKEVILPAFEDFAGRADSLLEATKVFAGKPGEASLEQVRRQWQNAALSWKVAGTYSFGPIDDHFLSGAIDYPGVHYPNIEKSISTGTVIDDSYIESRGSSLKGLKAIEYLLYKNASGDSVVRDFASSQKRREYLAALASNLAAQARKVLEAWKGTDAPFAAAFARADGRDIKSSLGILVNKCVSQVNLIKDERLAVPLGMRNGGSPDPASVEGRLSGTSLALVRSEIAGVQKCFGNEKVAGLYALLDQLNAMHGDKPLSQAIAGQFAEVDKSAGAISLPLDAAITQETEKVKDFYNSLKKLQVLIGVDVVNQLGIILTFSDNDGD